ncbi:MAG: AsmA family protein [Deltaproteobacteria bacterium]|nr:AsmA family protein [Deltaproteobacteria bacterium]
MKKLGIIAAIVVAVFALLFLFKNILIKAAVEGGTRKATGLELTIEDMDVGLFSSKVDITDMRLLNPAGFPDKVMIDIPKFLVDVELASFFKGGAHVETIVLDLKELMVVRNKDRKLNLSALKSVSEKQQKGRKPVEQKEEKKAPQVVIDTLVLKIGKVTYKDYSWSTKPFTKTFNIGINEVYRNITDPKKLVNLIIVRALQKTNIAQLANFDLDTLKADVGDTLKTVEKAATEAGEKELEDLEKSATEEAEKAVGKDVIEGLKKQLE